jgi:hypothetical protein
MPALPPWAKPGRIVEDRDLGLIFVKWDRRGLWQWWIRTNYPDVAVSDVSAKTLAAARDRVATQIGQAIETMVRALHPAAAYVHWEKQTDIHRSWVTKIACGAPAFLQGSRVLASVTCPTCIAVAAEDVEALTAKLGHEAIGKAREYVTGVRDTNKLAKLVVGEAVHDDI